MDGRALSGTTGIVLDPVVSLRQRIRLMPGATVRLIAQQQSNRIVVEVSDDDRCSTFSPGGVASDGTAYFSPWDYHAAVRGVFGRV